MLGQMSMEHDGRGMRCTVDLVQRLQRDDSRLTSALQGSDPPSVVYHTSDKGYVLNVDVDSLDLNAHHILKGSRDFGSDLPSDAEHIDAGVGH